ncbi:hypothetical protein VCCP103710_1700, partial [Vibrio cholerae CP1037(10)]
MIRIN